MHNLRRPAVTVLLPALLFTSLIATRQDSDPEVTPRTEEVIRKGLKWLQSNQERDGSWG